jgi:hypothetical protein
LAPTTHGPVEQKYTGAAHCPTCDGEVDAGLAWGFFPLAQAGNAPRAQKIIRKQRRRAQRDGVEKLSWQTRLSWQKKSLKRAGAELCGCNMDVFLH